MQTKLKQPAWIVGCLSKLHRRQTRNCSKLQAFWFLLPPQQDCVFSSSNLCALTVVLCGRRLWLVKVIWSKGSAEVTSVLCSDLLILMLMYAISE